MTPPSQPAAGIGATSGYSQRAAGIATALDGIPEEELISLTLNGKPVKAKAGETIMEVCHREDVYVPHYCWHPSLSIAGNCRLCLVEVEKIPKPIIACQTHVTPEMNIKTNSEVAQTSQEWMMEFLLVNHPLDCPICDRGGECQLQRYSMEYGTSHTRMADKKRKFVKPQADPLIDIERNRCIMCTRCVRFCDEVGGEHLMGVFDRGNGNYIGTFGQGPVSNIFSGNVIDLCPVGCLTSRPYRFKARPWELTQTQSTCDHCSTGCKVTNWTRNNKLYRVTPPSRIRHDHFTINEDTEEFICNQGRFGSDYGFSDLRLDEAQVRIAGRLTPTSFNNALDRAAKELKNAIAKHGADKVAITLSSRTTNEEALAIRNLASDVLNVSAIDWRFGYSTKETADAVSLALNSANGSFEKEPDVIVVINGQLEQQVPVTAMMIQELGRRYGKKIVMLGHLHSDYIGKFAEKKYHNQPGRTAAVLGALKNALSDGAVQELSNLLNQSEEEIKSLIELLKSAEQGLIVQGLLDFNGSFAASEVPATINLAKALGENWEYLPAVSDRNAKGLNAVLAPSESFDPNALIDQIVSGEIKALISFGAESLTHLADNKTVASAVEKLDVFILADFFDTEISRQSDIFIPLTTNLERSGTYTDIEGNFALLNRSVEPSGDARSALEIAAGLARAFNEDSAVPQTLGDAWVQFRQEVAPNSVVSLGDLELEGTTNSADYTKIQVESQARNRSSHFNPGTYRKDGLRILGSLPEEDLEVSEQSAEVESSDAQNSFVLVWGSSVLSKGYLNDQRVIQDVLLPKPYLEILPQDAAELGIEQDQFAIIHQGGRKAKVAIKITKAPAPRCVYLTSGALGLFDLSSANGPVRVTLEPLDEKAPNQGDKLVAHTD